MKHKHADLIKAWADGAEIQYNYNSEWVDCGSKPEWYEFTEYRIKPEPKPDVVKHLITSIDLKYKDAIAYIADKDFIHRASLKLTFNGETGELKSAEVLK